MANKVYNNLSVSPFFVKIGEYDFYFSSVFRKNKFIKEWKEYLQTQDTLFKAKYNLDVDLSDLFLIAFYKKIEKRGCLIYYQNMIFDINNLKVIVI